MSRNSAEWRHLRHRRIILEECNVKNGTVRWYFAAWLWAISELGPLLLKKCCSDRESEGLEVNIHHSYTLASPPAFSSLALAASHLNNVIVGLLSCPTNHGQVKPLEVQPNSPLVQASPSHICTSSLPLFYFLSSTTSKWLQFKY